MEINKPLITEMRNPRTTHIDRMTTADMLRVMNNENRRVPDAVEEALGEIAIVVEHIARQLPLGGRIIYVGAGTSGRIGVMDASECPPTFGVPPETVVALMAGGAAAITQASAEAEDDAAQGCADLEALTPNATDTIIGISAAGAASYVMGALYTAKSVGALAVSLCGNPDTPMARMANVAICVNTGPEVITGSTRLKAGTAQKMVLNLISTAVMIKIGKVYENYMVDVKLSNEKLCVRASHTVSELTGCTLEEARAALKATGNVRAALVMLGHAEENTQ